MVATSMLPTVERENHDAVVIESIRSERQRRQKRARVLNTLQIEILRQPRRGKPALDERQYTTALQLATLFDRAGRRPATICAFADFIDRGMFHDANGAREHAYRAWRRAMELVSPWGSEILWSVVCMNAAAGSADSVSRLRCALDHLAAHEGEWWSGRLG